MFVRFYAELVLALVLLYELRSSLSIVNVVDSSFLQVSLKKQENMVQTMVEI